MRHGNKKTHWIWYIFPQLRGISLSINSMYYGISSRAEAEAYIMHPILGPRLTEITQIVLSHLAQPQCKLHTVMNTTIDAKKICVVWHFLPRWHRMCTTCRHHGLGYFWKQPIKLLLLREHKDTNVHILLSKCSVCGNNTTFIPHPPTKKLPPQSPHHERIAGVMHGRYAAGNDCINDRTPSGMANSWSGLYSMLL